ncbi:MAG TPA: ATP-binding protein [Candidatus Nanoarchaeia archaeon]|nr:ATP-binding protein [Candidatus Nanoarchaeia archaeon]
MKPDWYVLAGGPCSGKTTTVNELKKLGFHIIPEAATTLMKEGTVRKDENNFTKKVLKKNIENEKNAPRDKVVFFERAVPDCIGYNLNYDKTTDVETVRLCIGRDYKRIFFLEQVPYKKTRKRIETEEEAKRLSTFLYMAYRNLGYDMVLVPNMGIEERINLILEKIK